MTEGLPDSPSTGGVCKLSGYWCVGRERPYAHLPVYARFASVLGGSNPPNLILAVFGARCLSAFHHGETIFIYPECILMSMAQQSPTATMTCAHCGTMFRGNPKSQPLGSANYCSLACEEGRGPRAMSDPQSPDYHLYLRGEPGALVGKVLVANGLKRVDYSADWCKGPEDWSHSTLVDHSEQDVSYIRKDNVVLGTVVDYSSDGYTVEHENIETGEVTTRTIHDFLMVAQLRDDRWWVDG